MEKWKNAWSRILRGRGDIYIGDFSNNLANGFGRQDIYIDGVIQVISVKLKMILW